MQDPAQRIPNVTTNKVDITIQFMTMSAQRSQLINFSRPYYVEGVALLTLPTAENKTFDKLLAGGSATRVSILQNVDASIGAYGPAGVAGHADRHPGQRPAGAGIQARRRGRRRSLHRALARLAQSRQIFRCGKSWSPCCTARLCGKAISTG